MKIKSARMLLAAAAVGCAFAPAAQADGEKIAVFTKNQTNPYFHTIRVASETAAKQMKATVIQYVPTKPDNIPEQMSQIEDVVTKKPNAIVFIPVDSRAMVPGVEKINAAGIPVVNSTDRSFGGNFVSFIGGDDLNLSLATGRYLLKAMGGKGNVLLIEGVRGSNVSAQRVDGYKKALAEFPNVKLLAAQPGNFQRLVALQVTENLLQSFPQVDGIMAANDAMALGAIEALDGAKRKALVVGLNGDKEAIEAVKSGRLLATGDYNTFKVGCIGMMAAIRTVRKLPVPKEYLFPPEVVDKTNWKGKDTPVEQRPCPTWEAQFK